MPPRLLIPGLVCAALTFVASAQAEAPPTAPPGGIGVISEYVETVPTSDGWVVAGGSKNKSKVSPRTRERLKREAGSDAAALEQVVGSASAPQKSSSAGHSSLRSGTPRQRPISRTKGGLRGSLAVTPSATKRGFVSGVTGSTGSTGKLLALGAALLAICVGAAAITVFRRRTRPS